MEIKYLYSAIFIAEALPTRANVHIDKEEGFHMLARLII